MSNCIAAMATAPGKASLCSIRISGDDAFSIAARHPALCDGVGGKIPLSHFYLLSRKAVDRRRLLLYNIMLYVIFTLRRIFRELQDLTGGRPRKRKKHRLKNSDRSYGCGILLHRNRLPRRGSQAWDDH